MSSRIYLALACLLPLSACSLSGMVPDASSQFALSAPLPTPASGVMLPWQLQIEEPSVPLALNTARIPVEKADGALDYYAGVSWVDRIPALVQTRLTEGFENTHRLKAVVGYQSAISADLALSSDLRDVRAKQSAQGTTVMISMAARLIDLNQRQAIATQTFDISQPADGNDFAAVRKAYDLAFASITGQIIDWSLSQMPVKAGDVR